MRKQNPVDFETCNGVDVGRDPREMSHDELRQTGHNQISPLKALRLKCLDCCCGSANEVRLCTAVDCPSWPFRLGKTPWRQPLSAEAKAKLAANFGSNLSPVPTNPQKTGGQNPASDFDGGLPPNGPGHDFPPRNLTSKPDGAK
jgi:hypothetical protein